MLLNAVALNTLVIGGTLVSPISTPVSTSSAMANSSGSVIAKLYNITARSQASSSTSSLASIKVEARLASSNTNAVTSSVGKIIIPVVLISYVPGNLCQGGSHALNTSMLNSTSTNSCVFPAYGSQALSISYGRLLVQAKLASSINSAISESPSAILGVSAYLKGTASNATTKAYDSILIERTLALEECRMMSVPEYLHTMEVMKVTRMRSICS
jgi:hypothetical protein